MQLFGPFDPKVCRSSQGTLWWLILVYRSIGGGFPFPLLIILFLAIAERGGWNTGSEHRGGKAWREEAADL